MHGLDTLKTRLQGQPYPLKYNSLYHCFQTVWKLEGISGFYGGIQPAMIGSIFGTMIYFGSYETFKRTLRDFELPETGNHLISAGIAEVMVSTIYVPSEVLKTRMQLQGKYNNPHFISGYNYKNWREALTTIIKNDGLSTMFRGYQATLLRDVPCTAIQFTIYESLKNWYLKERENTLLSEMLMGGIAGSMAGGITTPLDVVKTVLQTQQIKESIKSQPKRIKGLSLPKVPNNNNTLSQSLLSLNKLPNGPKITNSNGIIDALKSSYNTYGFQGLFRGLAPRTLWMGFQSAIMFVIYEQAIAWF
ncbi:mitochondrial carrier [Neoconidiobolus thromboides FSU 785]|nr:mitochondrial carrier [Neoconidiobolus thromboides FSU 785]